jgi:hypothetical protein
MQHLWSRAGAISGNWWQMGRPQKRLKQAEIVAIGNRLRPGLAGTEGRSTVRVRQRLKPASRRSLTGRRRRPLHLPRRIHRRRQPSLKHVYPRAARLRAYSSRPPRRPRDRPLLPAAASHRDLRSSLRTAPSSTSKTRSSRGRSGTNDLSLAADGYVRLCPPVCRLMANANEALMEQSGRNRWQAVASATTPKPPKPAKTVAVGCHRFADRSA